MKIGLLMGILLVLTVASSCVAPKTPEILTPEPVASDTYTVTIMPGGEWGINTMWPGPETEPEFYKLTGCPTPVPTVIHTLSSWTAPERAKTGMSQGWGLEIYPGIPERLMPGDYPPMPPSEEEMSQILSQFPMSTPTVWPSPEPVLTGVHTITVGVDTVTVLAGWNTP